MPPSPTSADADRTIVLYGRPGCHLCEEAAELLDAILGPDGYRSVDIEPDDDLLARYAHRIPVVSVDGVDRLEGLITGPAIRAIVEASPA